MGRRSGRHPPAEAKVFCVELGCRRKVFTEALPGTVARYGRRTWRSGEALRWLTLALGGRAGARLAERLGLLASRSTLLRELHHRRPAALIQALRVLGIDDWAWRKGRRYGTILCDLETRKVVDLLPDRDANSVAAWLQQHPGTKIISRDRGGIYAEAARRAAPQAVQVADRWHLLRNLSGALGRAIAPHHHLFSQAARASRLEDPAFAPPPVAEWSQRELLVQQVNRQRRYERWERVRELFLKTRGSDQDLARQLGIDHRTVKKFRSAELYPEASNRYWLRQRRSYRTRAASPPQRPALRASPRQVVWLILKAAPSAKEMLEQVYRKSPENGRIAELAKDFFRIPRTQPGGTIGLASRRTRYRPGKLRRWPRTGHRRRSRSSHTVVEPMPRRRPGASDQAHQTPDVRQSRLRTATPPRPE